MLVFTRKRDQTIMIGEGVEVRVLRIGREGVRLGVTAPADVAVHRREVYDLIREENCRAVATTRTRQAVLRAFHRDGAGARPRSA